MRGLRGRHKKALRKHVDKVRAILQTSEDLLIFPEIEFSGLEEIHQLVRYAH